MPYSKEISYWSLPAYPADGQRRDFDLHSKWSKDIDNKRLKSGEQSALQEETEIKRCYGGEENDEKVDPSKDDKLSENIFQTLSSTERNTKHSEKHSVYGKVRKGPKDNAKVTQVADNKMAEKMNKNLVHVLDYPQCNGENSQNSNDYTEMTPQSVFGNQLNNLDENLSNDIRNQEEKLTTGVLNICNVIATAFPEDNFMNHYVREQNVMNTQEHRKNLQKHVSDLLSSLRTNISTGEEGVDEEGLSNSLVSLYLKLHSKLTPHQLKKVMEAIGREGRQLMRESSILSKGGDSDLKEGGEKICGRKDHCDICNGSGSLDHDEREEKVAFDVVGKNWEDTEVSSVGEKYKSTEENCREGVLDEVKGQEEVEEVLEECDAVTRHPGNRKETRDSVLKEAVEKASCEETSDSIDAADKAGEESMEKDILEDSNEDEQDLLEEVDELDDGPQVERKEDVRSPFDKQVTFPAPSLYILQWYQFLRKRSLQKKMKKWNKATYLGKPGRVKKHLRIDPDGPCEVPGTNPDPNLRPLMKLASTADEYRDEKLDLRVGYYRARSCMNTEGGGGNSSLGGRSSSSDGSSSNRPGRGSGHDRHPPDDNLPRPQHLLVEADIPGQDYKAVRKKHADMSDEMLIDLLGSLSPDTSPSMHGDNGLLNDVNHCMLIVLHDLSSQSDVYCSICNVLHYLFNHFARCQQLYRRCNICWQVHRLSLYHVQSCLQSQKTARESSSDICQQLLETVSFNVELVQSRSEQLFLKMKKYVDKVLHPYGLHGSGSLGMYSMSEKGDGSSVASGQSPAASLTLDDSMPSASSARAPQVPTVSPVAASSFGGQFSRSGSGRNFQPSLKRILESPGHDVASLKVNWKPRGRGRLSRQLSNETAYGASKYADNSIPGSKSDDGPSMEPVRHARKTDMPQGSIGELAGEGYLSLPTGPADGCSSRSSMGNFDDLSIATSVSSGQNDEEPSAEDVIYDRYKPMMDTHGVIFEPEARPYSTEGEVDKIYGVSGAMSLPIRSTFQGEHDQNISLTTAPTGEPGIGEVVYGTRRQLKKVARFWANIRCQVDHEAYKHQMREEGVILESAKKHLRILRTRYQKKNQWMRLVHLGNGVAGKCHLARDSTTGFSFCVKRVHIAKYEENELVIWCDLDHANIVKLYGAIRHGPKIYILCEFVDGGSLTSLINEQRSLNRRLSHWMCLRYFKQLLQVLVYLKTCNVLHEDLKADNILVKRNTTLIAVTDFGLGKYLNVDSEMKGMSPTGSQTQWSPEKATSIGHGFAADVWAAVCILVHMLSGYPPWTQRFPGAQMLHFVIFMQSPPLDDVPANIQEVVRDLITQGFTVDPKLRPPAASLLKHPAFRVLEQGAPTSYYSTLKSTGQPLPDNQLDPTEASGPQELEEILSSLSARSQAARSQAAPQGSRQPSLSERRLPSVEYRVSEGSSGWNLGSGLAKHNSSEVVYQRSGVAPVPAMHTASSDTELQQDKNDGQRTLSRSAGTASVDSLCARSPEAPGAFEDHAEEGNQAFSEGHSQDLANLPTVLQGSLHDIPDGVTGKTWSFSTSFEDSDQHIQSFLSDIVPRVEFLQPSQALHEYRPYQRTPFDNMPRLSVLLNSNQLTFSGITLDEQNTMTGQEYEGTPCAAGGDGTGQSSGDRSPNPGQSSGDRSPNPGQSSGDRSPNPGQSSGDRSPNPGQSSGDRSSNLGQSSGDRSSKPGQSSGDRSSNPGQSSGDRSSKPGQSSGDRSSKPGQSSGDRSSNPGQSSGNRSSNPGKSSGDRSSNPGQSSGDRSSNPGQSSGESSLEGLTSSPLLRVQQSPETGVAMNSEGQDSPMRSTPLSALQSTPNTSPIETRVNPSPQDDLGPMSYYPPSGFYEEHIDSSDLFGDGSIQGSPQETGDGSEEASAVDYIDVKPETSGNHDDPSLESMEDPSAYSGAEDVTQRQDFDFSGAAITASPQAMRKSRPPSKSVTSFFRGTPDYAVETSKTKDCPIESESIDIPGPGNGSRPCEDVVYARKQDGGRSLEKKNPGLTIDVTCTATKKLAYKRNQSTPAESKPRSPPNGKQPQSEPMQNRTSSGMVKKVEGSSGLGVSLPCHPPSEPCLNSGRSSDTSGVFLPDKGRLSSTEFSPKSLYEHQEKEFSALGKASQSDLSGQEHEDMMALGDIPDEGIPFTILDPEHESFENQLLSVQKNLKAETDISEFGCKLYLIRENGESVKQILVPLHYEEWGKLTDTIRQAVRDILGFDHYTLKDIDGSPVNYNSTLYKTDRKVMVCCLEAGETTEGCWCDQHELQLMHFA
ncbi:uncharacterized protein [Haliotis cracherodii]|uniref:uncharacterized protein isoform X2 n=1 Tax=Haliotis cracherodii TaxID=6455 RepID=UPI0039EA0FDA